VSEIPVLSGLGPVSEVGIRTKRDRFHNIGQKLSAQSDKQTHPEANGQVRQGPKKRSSAEEDKMNREIVAECKDTHHDHYLPEY
jgi:hypothetical protein